MTKPMSHRNHALVALKGKEATARELGVESSELSRARREGLVRKLREVKAGSARPAAVYKLTADGSKLARKLEREAAKA